MDTTSGNPLATPDPGLASGSAGQAVFYAYLDSANLFYGADEIAATYLGEAAEAVSAVSMSPSLYGGFTGVAWAMAHLENQFLEIGDEDPNEEIDSILGDFLDRTPWTRDYDLAEGLVGFGVYALERLPRPSAAACLSRVVDRLYETAESQPPGITWLTSPDWIPLLRPYYPDGHYNLGLAHGVPGVIALLGAACAAGVAVERARSLLEGAVAWLLAQQPEGGGFPYSVAPGTTPNPARLAWCYGDPGIAAALLVAARGAGQPEWEEQAMTIARRAASCPPDLAGVVDAGLCHGAAGLGHIFNRLYQATGHLWLADAGRFWFSRTLELRRPGAGIGGFSSWEVDEQGAGRWEDVPGLLTGAAGVGLALAAAATDREPEWDRALLLSLV